MLSLAKKVDEERTFVIAVVGLVKREVDSLRRLSSITKVRNRDYEIRVIDHAVPEAFSGVDMVMLDARTSDGPVLWNRLRRSLGELGRRPVIKVSTKKTKLLPEDYGLHIPFNPSKLLKLLDVFTIKELDYLPEFSIGSEGESSSQTRQGIELLKLKQNASQKMSVKGGRARSLVIDDSAAVRKQLEIEFGVLDFNVDVASCGRAALVKVEAQVYDIIFLDVVMEDEDGYGVCRKIRHGTTNKATPIVMLTSKASTIDRLKGTLSGCSSYLTKPINHTEFVKEVKKFVNSTAVGGQL